MSKSPGMRFNSIDGLRAYSALGILAMHVLSNGFDISNGFVFSLLIPSMANLVFLFMIVSAFGMCCGYYEKIKGQTIDLSQFYSKRFKKTLPFFSLLVALDLVISPSVESFYEAFADLTLAFGFLPDGGGISVIGVGWFLGVVFAFYMLFPFFVFLIDNKKRAWFVLLILLVYNIVCAEYFDIDRKNIIYSGCYFVAGGLIYLYKDPFVSLKNRFRWVVLLLIAVFAFLYFNFSSSTIVMLPLYSFMLIYAVVCGYNCRRYILDNPVTKFLSGISMEIYLSHMVIYRLLEKMNIIHLLGKGIIGYIFAFIVVTVGAVVFSFVAQKIINCIILKIIGLKNNSL